MRMGRETLFRLWFQYYALPLLAPATFAGGVIAVYLMRAHEASAWALWCAGGVGLLGLIGTVAPAWGIPSDNTETRLDDTFFEADNHCDGGDG
ncbi:MAG: hypothetical protein AAF601_14890 [Pseudomonadota bacterium]